MIAAPLDIAADPATAGQDALFEKVAAEFAAPLVRLARAHEADPHQQQDLLQEIHIALWRSLAAFGERCSLRTWVYRVAHNVAATHVLRNRRRQMHRLTTLDEIDLAGETPDVDAELDAGRALQKIHALIQALKPLDRQVIILHLEGLPADEIADIVGISPANTHTKLTRIRQLLAAQVGAGRRRRKHMNSQQLWQAQALDAPRISLAFVRQQSDSLRRWAWRRNAINYVAAVAFLPFFVWVGWSMFSVKPLVSLALLFNLPGFVWLLVRWHKRAASQEQPAELGVLDALKFHRRQLERQRDVRLDRWRRWPAIPGILLLLIARAIEVTPTPWMVIGRSVLLMTLILATAIVIEERIAHRIQKEIDALDSL